MEIFRIGISDEISVKNGGEPFAKYTKIITSFWLQSKWTAMGERRKHFRKNTGFETFLQEAGREEPDGTLF